MVLDVTHLTPWTWLIVGGVLMILELLQPGFFLLWIGLAALMVGVIFLAVPLSVPFQVIAFVLLSGAFILIGRAFWKRYVLTLVDKSLNKRGESLIGQTLVLDQPLQGGRSQVRVGDSVWMVKGPNLPRGSTVVIVAIEGTCLVVEEKMLS